MKRGSLKAEGHLQYCFLIGRCDKVKGQKPQEDAVAGQTLLNIGQYASSQDKRLDLFGKQYLTARQSPAHFMVEVRVHG